MNIYAVPSLVGTILALLLAATIWLDPRRDRLNLAFGGLVTGIGVFCLLAFLLRQADSIEAYARRLRLLIYALPLVYGTALYYVLVLTGYVDDRKRRVLGVSVNAFVGAVIGLSLLSLIAFSIPGLMVRDYVRVTGLGFDIATSPLIYPLVVLQAACLLMLFAYLVNALKRARAASRRRFLRHNIVGLGLGYGVAVVAGILLPKLGHTHASVFVETSLATAALVFYSAILRYQFDRYQELHQGLEGEVRERTQHLREAQARLVQSEKMAALGDLVAGIVHEINSPLAVVRSSIGLTESAVAKLATAAVKAETIEALRQDRSFQRSLRVLEENRSTAEQAIERIERLVASLKRFAHLDEADEGYANINEALDTALALLGNETEGRIEIVRAYAEVPPVYCNPSEINQVLMNLLRNAVKAIKGKGTLTLTTWTTGDRVAASISDSGRGIADEQRERLFDFQFNIQTSRVRMGMGLATSYQLIQRHGGEILVDSQIGRGSTFTVLLPTQPKKTTAPAERKQAGRSG